MKILAVDQARSGAWSVFDYEARELLTYGSFDFASKKFTYAETMVGICEIVKDLMQEHQADAVFIEDIQLRQNPQSFKRLAQLQGALVSMFERNNYLYDYIPPSRWQAFCKARGRSAKELKEKITTVQALDSGRKQSKVLSIEFIKERFGIETENDNIADAICMGYYVVEEIAFGVIGNKT